MASSNSSLEKPKNVSSRLWEKFKSLEKRTDEVTKRSTEKRIKHLQKQVMDTVTQEFTSPEDKDILRKHDVKFGPPVETVAGKKRKTETNHEFTGTKEATATSSCDLLDYMNVNQHLHQTDHSRPPPPTALETKIDAAIKSGNLKEAEELSDRLAGREAGEKIVAAIDAKNFLEDKKVQDQMQKAKRKRKLNWGFEPKHRWETKGNM
ncbi:protein FAM204A [Aplysia californica]|uniref:Protein FAM204A n=1 Tax=Aplysia californica TaxID=6500 RepID=A0ABM0JTJ0_APLCA|nr:protein FAM204A [Aplysia californica]